MNKQEKFWDKQSSRFAKQVEKDEFQFRKTLASIKDFLKESDIVLDFACGIGTSSFNMASHVKEVHAMDISSGMINVCRKRQNEIKIDNVHFVHTNIFDEQFADESFDVIAAFNILHLVDNPQKTMHRIFKLMKPGGFFISSTPCLKESGKFLGFMFKLLSKIGFVPELKLFKYKELEEYLTKAQLAVIETHTPKTTSSSYLIIAKK